MSRSAPSAPSSIHSAPTGANRTHLARQCPQGGSLHGVGDTRRYHARVKSVELAIDRDDGTILRDPEQSALILVHPQGAQGPHVDVPRAAARPQGRQRSPREGGFRLGRDTPTHPWAGRQVSAVGTPTTPNGTRRRSDSGECRSTDAPYGGWDSDGSSARREPRGGPAAARSPRRCQG